MSQASATTVMTINPSVTVVCSSTSSLLSTVTVVPSLMGLPATSDQYGMVLLPPMTMSNSGGVFGHATVLQQQHQSQMPIQAYANYAMNLSQADFPFKVQYPTICICVGICYGICFLLSGSMLDAILTYGGLNIGVCTTAALWSLPMAGICATW